MTAPLAPTSDQTYTKTQQNLCFWVIEAAIHVLPTLTGSFETPSELVESKINYLGYPMRPMGLGFLVHTEDDESSKAGFPLAKSYIQDAQRTLHQNQGAIQSMPAMWPHPSPNSCCRASKEFMRLMVRVAPLLGAALSC